MQAKKPLPTGCSAEAAVVENVEVILAKTCAPSSILACFFLLKPFSHSAPPTFVMKRNRKR